MLLTACGGSSTVSKPDGGEVVTLTAHDVSLPLRDMAKLVQPRARDEADEAEPVRRIPHPKMRRTARPDAVVQDFMGQEPIVMPTVSFEGMGAGISGFQPGGVPPDTDGDIGPNHYVQLVNTSIAVFSRTGTQVMAPADTQAMWMGFSGACSQTNDGDATVRYDHIADRWVVAQFSISTSGSTFYQCIAVSTTGDPTGTYTRYQFSYNALNDYPKLALWPDAYYFTFNMFPNSGFAGGKVCAMDRTKMLAGAADATMQCFDAGANYGGLLASDVDGKTLPPSGAPNYVVALDTDTDLAYWQLHVDFTTPTSSTFTGPMSVPISSFTPLCDGGTCVVEPGSGSQLDSLADRAMNRFVYRRFADHESLLLSHSVTASTGGGVRWYEVRTPATPMVFQQGTYAPDGAFRWMPSIAMDSSGDIAMIYSVSSTSINPGIRYTARTATDPPGTMGLGEATVVAGAGTQTGVSRWGDYAALNIDPADDCTFWGTQEYKHTSGRSNWSTRVVAFTLPSCGSFALTADPQTETVTQGGTATYMIDTMTTGGSAQSVALTLSGLPTGVTGTFNPATVMSGSNASITLTADATAMLGATHYTVTAAGATTSAMIDIMLTVEPAAMPDAGPGATGDAGTAGSAGGGCCSASSGDSPLGTTLLGAGVLLMIGRRRRRVS